MDLYGPRRTCLPARISSTAMEQPPTLNSMVRRGILTLLRTLQLNFRARYRPGRSSPQNAATGHSFTMQPPLQGRRAFARRIWLLELLLFGAAQPLLMVQQQRTTMRISCANTFLQTF